MEEVDQTPASPEDKHNLIISVDLAPDLFPTQKLSLKPRKNPEREETFHSKVGAVAEIIRKNTFILTDDSQVEAPNPTVAPGKGDMAESTTYSPWKGHSQGLRGSLDGSVLPQRFSSRV